MGQLTLLGAGSSGAGNAPAPSGLFISTEASDHITTEAGDSLITE